MVDLARGHVQRPGDYESGAISPAQPTISLEIPRDSWASSDRARNVMRGNRSRDTRPELAVRSAVHRLGLRFRVSARPISNLRRSADLVFRPTRVAVFVD